MADDEPTDKERAPPPLAGKARDLEALRNAVVDAANVSVGFWFSYIFVLLYLVIAVGSVTHRNLFFENPVKLPFLNVELPLIGFFVLGPALFLIVHVYILLHFVMLAGKVGAFHAELDAQIADEDVRARLRRQLPSNIFVQVLAGPSEVRTGFMGLMLRLIARISLVGAPLALLVFFEFQFLPYHHEGISWWLRLAVVADLAVIWALWPSIARGRTSSIGWSDLKRGSVIAKAVASLVPILLVFTIATFPGEWLHKNPVSIPIIPDRAAGSIRLISLHQYLVAGDVDLIARKPTSLWSNRLVLPNLEQPPANFAARGRRLEGAVFLSANLQKVDFTAASLQDAVLEDADLREAVFGCASNRIKVEDVTEKTAAGREGRCAQLQRASFDRARMQGIRLDDADLSGASLEYAQLQGATLMRSHLQGASLDHAEMQAALLDEAHLQGASLKWAQLQGASLYAAELQAAQLDAAQLQGAYLSVAQLQNASLVAAQLQGASFEMASLNGASLNGAQLQGATFMGASLRGASFDRTIQTNEGSSYAQFQGVRLDDADLKAARLRQTMLWRTDPTRAKTAGALVIAPITDAKYHRLECDERTPCDWDAASYEMLRRMIETRVPDGANREWALERIAILDPAKDLHAQSDFAKTWAGFANSPITFDQYEDELADEYGTIGCDVNATTFEVKAMLTKLDSKFRTGSPALAKLAALFLDAAHCRGMQGITEADKKSLRQMTGVPPPGQSPAQK